MPRYSKTAEEKLVSRIAAAAEKRRGVAPPAFFVETLYRHAASEDVLSLREEALLGVTVSAWSAMQARRPGEIKLRVYNPEADENGFDLGYTVVEIVNDDMPFLVDSVIAGLNRTNISVHLVLHPVLRAQRTKAGKLTQIFDVEEAPLDAKVESLIQMHIDHHAGAEELAAIEGRIRSILEDVRAAVEDWPGMRKMIVDTIADIELTRPPVPADEMAEAVGFLRWLENDHFTFIGYRDYRFVTERGKTHIEIEPGSGMGILRKSSVTVFEELLELPELPPDVAAFMHQPEILMVGKANRHSTVQRTNQLDTVAVRRFDSSGRVVGGRLFAGLFTSTVFTSSPQEIPVLRRKVAAILEASGFEPKGHDGRGLIHVLENLPRNELFQVDQATLLRTSLGIMRLRQRQRVALFAHRDPLGRWVSCLVYVPRDRFDTRLRQRLEAIVTEGYGGSLIAFQTSISDEPMAQVHFIVKTTPGSPAPLSPRVIEQRLCVAARDWREDLREQLVLQHGAEDGRALLRVYGDAFPLAYCERYDSAEAVADVEHVAAAIDSGEIVVNLQQPEGAAPNELRLKLYRRDQPQPLSDTLPILENMGVRVIDEIPFQISAPELDRLVWIHDFGLSLSERTQVNLGGVKELFEEAMRGVCRGDIENDGFNRLVLDVGLSSRRIMILRAYCKFLLQAGIPFSQAYMENTLAAHPLITRSIVELFEALLDPARCDSAKADSRRLRSRIRRGLEHVASLDEDRILSRFTNAVTCTLRTNYFQRDADGAAKPYLSFKLNSRALLGLPPPRPFVEVFVTSPRVDAVHLRGGKVARGGIRWSDRPEDFRTEVLGLMKSQMTKNAVIVPVGGKGGFVIKRPPSEGSPDAIRLEAIECYKTLMRGLLDITDNLVDGRVVAPHEAVRRDGDDPYLVVAADKGTATFSDIANGVAGEYGFWLGDAFASGGSAGYDHKEMGITARGAWESIKRHFHELGRDALTTEFTCVGVGDMSGDVFGNGALYTRKMRLVAAFNHKHIFVDPSPDAAASYDERKRLFDLPGSSWADYDRKLISRGGGVFERSAKAIRVSAAMRKLFDLGKKATVTPTSLLRAILKCEVDLLFFGGIGTYVRASQESDADVGDRSNDALRVCGKDMRAKIIGEGANLGITQRGRVEYAVAGGRINTDFIDNSAGVDCSDHEVNIKIPLEVAMATGKLTRAKRDKLLSDMTEDVACLVLRDNYRQSNALSEAVRQSVALLDDHAYFLSTLERAGKLNREVESLPDGEEVDKRRAAGFGLTRPELAVLLAYAKIVLQEEVLASDLPDDPHLADGINGYFPKLMRRRFADLLLAHPLRREITATYVANTIVNRTGPGFVTSVQERTGAPAAQVARAYLVCRQVFRAAEIWADLDDLDAAVPDALHGEMRLEILDLIKRGTWWFLRSGPQGGGINEAVAAYAPAVATLEKNLDRLVPTERRRSRDRVAARYIENGAHHSVARRIANLDLLTASCDIVRIAARAGIEPAPVARAYYGLGAELGIDWLRDAGERLIDGDRWRKAAARGLIDDLYAVQTGLTTNAIESMGEAAADGARLEAWISDRGYAVDRLLAIVGELRSAPSVDLPMLSVAAADMRALTNA